MQYGDAPQTYQTNGVFSDGIANNGTMTLKIPATLANCMLAFEFYNGDTPVTTGIAGNLTATGKFKNGRNRSLGTINLATADTYPIMGVYNSLTFSLTGLTGATRVVISAIQYANIIDIPSSADGGATSVTVTSPDGSVIETAPSIYDPAQRKINLFLEATGGGVSVADYTKYSYPISCKNTPTFQSGEEYIVALPRYSGISDFLLEFNNLYSTGATSYGSVAISFSATFNNTVGFTAWTVSITDIPASAQPSLTTAQLNDLFTFTAYNITTPVVVNGVSISGVVLTIKFKNALPFNATTKTVKGLVSTSNLGNYTTGLNPNSNAMLAIVTGMLTGVESTAVGASGGVPTSYPVQSNVPNMVDNNLPRWLNGMLGDSGYKASQISFKYSKIYYVATNGVDANTASNNGSQNAPFKTVAYALTIAPTGSCIMLLDKTTEPALTITKANIDISTVGTRSALCGFTNKVTINNTVSASSIRLSGLAFDAGLETASTNTGGLYVYNGQIGTSGGTVGFTKNDGGYTEFVGVDASNYVNTLSKGTIAVVGGKLAAPVISGTGTRVAISGDCTVVGNATVAAGAILAWLGGYHYAQATGYAVTAPANATVLIDGVQFVRPDGTLAPLSLAGNWSTQYTEFARATSILTGTNLGAIDWFDKIGLLNLRNITNATKMLVADPASGEVCTQDVPVAQVIPVQFNVPVSSLYSNDLTSTVIDLKNSNGSTQSRQIVQMCNLNGSITLDQLFCATVDVGKTLTYKGRMVVYNAEAVTQPNYYIIVQMVGAIAGTGQWVNLGDATSVQISKTQYAYTPINFSGSYTNPSGSAIDAIGLRVQLLYGQQNATAFVDTMFIEGSVS